MLTDEHRVVPIDTTQVSHRCGHEGPTSFKLVIAGRELEINEKALATRAQCAQCVLDSLSDGVTECSSCNELIFKDQDCVMHNGQLCCLKVACGPGTIAGSLPGKWDGSRFVDGFSAGTIHTF